MSRLTSWMLNGLYAGALAVCFPLLLWAMCTQGKYRQGFAAKFWGAVPRRRSDAPCIWLHAVSVGEVNLLGTTVAALRHRRPDLVMVISTTTKAGYEVAQRKYSADHQVIYCPLDFSWAVERAVRRLRPDLLVLAELELWPNLIRAAKRHGARVAIINGRLGDSSFRGYLRVRPLVGRVLQQIDLIAVQDQATADRFGRLRYGSQPTEYRDDARGAVVVTGSLKYDGAETDRMNPRTVELRDLAGLDGGHTVCLAGSTQAPEEAMVLRLFRDLRARHPRLRLVLVPRHPERFGEVARLLEHSGLAWQRRTKLAAERSRAWQVLLVDTVGELGAWWGLADIGLVGGSFGDRGGQNMIEPAAYGVATCFGPNTKNFRDIVGALLAADAAEVVPDEAALREFVVRCLEDQQFANELGQRAKALVTSQLGATERTVDLLVGLLPKLDSANNVAA